MLSRANGRSMGMKTKENGMPCPGGPARPGKSLGATSRAPVCWSMSWLGQGVWMVVKPSIAKSRLGNGVRVGGSARQSQGGESPKPGDSLGPDFSF